jgi:membrane associated rhomboid family serine protease
MFIAYKFQVWRLLTGLFVSVGILMLLFSMISYVPQAMQIEQQIGTVRMFWRFLLLGLTINIIFTLLCALGGFGQLVSMGVWPLIFAEIVIDCMR